MNPSDFLDIVSPNKDDPTVFKLGSIPAGYVSGRPTILFDGESIASTRTYPCLSSYVPAANDRVVLALVGHVFTIIGKIDSGASPWIVPTLLNGWSNWAGGWEVAGYYKDSSGIVHFKGLLNSGSVSASIVIFNLPIGFRPTSTRMIPVMQSNNTMTPLYITTSGDVVLYSTVIAGWLSLEGVIFNV